MSAAACMFCGQAPCVCNKPAKPKSKPKVTPSAGKPVVHDAPSPMSSATFQTAAPKVASPMDAAQQRPEHGGIMEYAIELFLMSGMVHPSDVPKLRRRLSRVKTPELVAKVQSWRKRNGKG